MKLPAIAAVIDRRILVNFRIDPEVMAAALPTPFRPKVVRGHAVGGICLIRLRGARPRGWPVPGLGSENAAHRIAVEWEEEGVRREGVYVPRRDTDSRLSVLAGGRVFASPMHHAQFTSIEADGNYRVTMESRDGHARIHVDGAETDRLPDDSVFASVAEASDFFEAGSLGYSDARTPQSYDGLELRCDHWSVTPLDVAEVTSSYFEDTTRFPPDTVQFDDALLMRDIPHGWCAQGSLRA